MSSGLQQANTFPPLISGSSYDGELDKQLYGSSVICSCYICKDAEDPFYYPTAHSLTGYAADGLEYVNGVSNLGSYASWYSENHSEFRGSKRAFPDSALVVITDLSIGIYDRDKGFDVWMIILRETYKAFPANIFANMQPGVLNKAIADGFRPSRVTYSSGVLSVLMSPDPGSQYTYPIVWHLDLSKDRMYVDLTLAAPDVYIVAPTYVGENTQGNYVDVIYRRGNTYLWAVEGSVTLPLAMQVSPRAYFDVGKIPTVGVNGLQPNQLRFTCTVTTELGETGSASALIEIIKDPIADITYTADAGIEGTASVPVQEECSYQWIGSGTGFQGFTTTTSGPSVKFMCGNLLSKIYLECRVTSKANVTRAKPIVIPLSTYKYVVKGYVDQRYVE